MNIFLPIVSFRLPMSVLCLLETLPSSFVTVAETWVSFKPNSGLLSQAVKKLQGPRVTGNLFHRQSSECDQASRAGATINKMSAGPHPHPPPPILAGGAPVAALPDAPATHHSQGQVGERLPIIPGGSPHQFQIKKSLKPQATFALRTLDSQGFLGFSIPAVKPETVQAQAGRTIILNAPRSEAQGPRQGISGQSRTGMGRMGRGGAFFKSVSKVATTQMK